LTDDSAFVIPVSVSNAHQLRLGLGFSLVFCLSTGVSIAQMPSQDDFEPIVFGDSKDHTYDKPFFEPTVYDEAITHPDEILGQPLGSRLSRHSEILTCFRRWATESDRVEHTYVYELTKN